MGAATPLPPPVLLPMQCSVIYSASAHSCCEVLIHEPHPQEWHGGLFCFVFLLNSEFLRTTSMKQTCHARTRMLGPGIHITGSDFSTCEDTFIVFVSFPPITHKEQSRQSQDACSLSRCNEPVYATAWSWARNSQEA